MGTYSGMPAKGHDIECDLSDIWVILKMRRLIWGKMWDDQDVGLSAWYCFGALGPSVL